MLSIYAFNVIFFLYRGPRSRKRTISARTRDEEPKIVDREILDPKSDNNDQDENYDPRGAAGNSTVDNSPSMRPFTTQKSKNVTEKTLTGHIRIL